jgi:hypothetical protein
MGQRVRTCFDKFNSEQVLAVIAYLEWKRDASEHEETLIAEALQRYWQPRKRRLLGEA